MKMDLVIEGRMFVNGEIKSTSVGIEDGKIVTVGNIVRGGDERLDFKEKLILPGFVDPHVHFRDPGMSQKEDFRSGTMSALFGGVTCALDMPNTKPPVTDVRSFKEKKSTVRSKAYVDYGLFAALTPNCDTLSLAPMAVGFKLFMGSTTGNILMNDDNDIYRIMCGVAKTGKTVSVHAEDNSMIGNQPENNNWDHLKNRPLAAEHNAIKRLARYKGMKVNICHVTDAQSLATASSLGFTTEVTAHHLFFNAENVHDAIYKVNPPLRDESTREKLFAAFKEGKATMFGSDHAPHTLADKLQDYDSAPSGVPGVETTVPIFMNQVKRSALPLGLLVRMGAEAPAQTFGLRKGRIAVGYDADFSIFDMQKVESIDVDRMHSKAGQTPYGGREAIFPDTVIIRGEVQVSERELCGGTIGEDVCGN